MRNLFILFSVMTLGIASCVNTKYVYKGNHLYQIGDTLINNRLVNTVTTYTVKNGFKADIDNNTTDNYLTITPEDSGVLSDPKYVDAQVIIPYKPIKGWRADTKDQPYFPEPKLVIGDLRKKRFVYFDSKPALQALTIPLRIRPALTNPGYKDSFPSQAEAGFSVNLAFGWQFNIANVFNGKKSLFGGNLETWSLTPGLLFGAGTTPLDSTNTRPPSVPFSRTAAIVTGGLYLSAGFNGINLGFAMGKDYATGSGSANWIYKGKTWYGIILGINLSN